MTTEDEKKNELIVINNDFQPLVAFYTKEGLDPLIVQIQQKIQAEDFDISTDKGRTKMRSFAKFGIAGSKTFIKKMSDNLRDEGRKKDIAIRDETKRMSDEIDKMRDEFLAPLIEFENKAKERKQVFETALFTIEDGDLFEFPDPSEEMISDRIKLIADIYARDWQEFQGRADAGFMATTANLERALSNRIKSDKQAAELKRLQDEDAERKAQAERDRIAQEAADKAKAEAEALAAQQAKAEAERVEAEKAEAARIANVVAAKAEADRIEAEQAAARAESEKNIALEQAKFERGETAKREQAAKDKAEAEKVAAIEAERKRVSDENAAKAKEEAARAADNEHRGGINRDIVTALMPFFSCQEEAQKLVVALARNEIPHTKINY